MFAAGAGSATLLCLSGQVTAQGVAKQELPKEGIILVAMVKAKAGQEEAVKKVLEALVEPTRKEPGCLMYIVHRHRDDPRNFFIYEQYRDQAALRPRYDPGALRPVPYR